MNTEHTKGPWTAKALDAIDLFPYLVVGADGFSPVARCIPTGTTALGTVTNAQARANARLIAAAPELLAALETLLSVQAMRESGKMPKLYDWTNAHDMARKVIAKAR